MCVHVLKAAAVVEAALRVVAPRLGLPERGEVRDHVAGLHRRGVSRELLSRVGAHEKAEADAQRAEVSLEESQAAQLEAGLAGGRAAKVLGHGEDDYQGGLVLVGLALRGNERPVVANALVCERGRGGRGERGRHARALCKGTAPWPWRAVARAGSQHRRSSWSHPGSSSR